MQRISLLILLAAAGTIFAQVPASPAKPAAPAKSTPRANGPATAAAKPKAAPKQAAPTRVSPQEVANQLAEAHDAWGPSISSAIASTSLQEVAHEGSVYTFHLYAAGMSRDRLYNIVSWPVTQLAPIVVVKGVALDATGRAVCTGQLGTCGSITAPNEPVNLSSTLAPGRPVRIGIEAQDGSASAYTKIVPIPIRGADKGCSVEAVMLTPTGTAALIEGSGFPPNSEIDMELVNGTQRDNGKTSVDEKGTYSAAVMPVIQGVSQGTIKVSVTSPKCTPSLSFAWSAPPSSSAPSPAPAKPASNATAPMPTAPATK